MGGGGNGVDTSIALRSFMVTFGFSCGSAPVNLSVGHELVLLQIPSFYVKSVIRDLAVIVKLSHRRRRNSLGYTCGNNEIRPVCCLACLRNQSRFVGLREYVPVECDLDRSVADHD